MENYPFSKVSFGQPKRWPYYKAPDHCWRYSAGSRPEPEIEPVESTSRQRLFVLLAPCQLIAPCIGDEIGERRCSAIRRVTSLHNGQPFEQRPTPIIESCVIHLRRGGVLKSSIIIARCNVTLHRVIFFESKKKANSLEDRLFQRVQVKPCHSKPPVFFYQIELLKKFKSIAGGDYSSNDHPSD